LKYPGSDTAIPQKSFDFSISLPQTTSKTISLLHNCGENFPAAAKTVHINGKTYL
jgi:hypothetical protein